MGSVQDGSHEPVQASSSTPLAHTSNTQAREEQRLLHARLRLGSLHTIYKGRKLRLRWVVKKWGSDGARSRSLTCWDSKTRAHTPNVMAGNALLLTSVAISASVLKPSFLVSITDRRPKACAPPTVSPMPPPGLPGTYEIPGPSQFSPGSCPSI